ncbi:MAG: hypothetical protein ABI459_01535 [Deltaproteobacteria bacterium]
MRKLSAFLILASAMSLSACLDNDLERAGAGAIGGAVIADAVGGNVAAGAVIGAGAGVICDDVGVCR